MVLREDGCGAGTTSLLRWLPTLERDGRPPPARPGSVGRDGDDRACPRGHPGSSRPTWLRWISFALARPTGPVPFVPRSLRTDMPCLPHSGRTWRYSDPGAVARSGERGCRVTAAMNGVIDTASGVFVVSLTTVTYASEGRGNRASECSSAHPQPGRAGWPVNRAAIHRRTVAAAGLITPEWLSPANSSSWTWSPIGHAC